MFPTISKIARVLLLLCGGATALYGCPLYADGCDGGGDCASGFYCDSYSQRCEPVLREPECVRPDQCEIGETCTPDFICRSGSCDYHGCVRGYACGVVNSVHTCVSTAGDAGADAQTTAPADAGDASTSLPDAGDAGISDAGDASLDAGP
jgi:hypothetical protein